MSAPQKKREKYGEYACQGVKDWFSPVTRLHHCLLLAYADINTPPK